MMKPHKNVEPSITAFGNKSGVIAVLFLLVVALIFGAISLSIQTGQLVERRVKTDQSSDAAAIAFSSKSAQGLNFVAANNLAIAAASHMTGVMHLAADWGAIYKTIFLGESVFKSRGRALSREQLAAKLEIFYDLFRPVSNLYFRSASGLTKLNSTIVALFPYLGVVDAINVAGANAPGSIIIPFRISSSASVNPNAASNTESVGFWGQVKQTLGSLFSSFNLGYDGLKRINSDEAFCLAYHAGEQALGSNRHNINEWIDSGLLPDLGNGLDLKPIGTVIKTIFDLFGGLKILANLVQLKVGFAGCGFAKAGDSAPGMENAEKSLIAPILQTILMGPLSGRPVELKLGSVRATIQPTKTASQLESEVNSMRDMKCDRTRDRTWAATPLGNTKFRTNFQPMAGMCIYPRTSKRVYDINNSSLNHGDPFNGAPDESHEVLFDYDVACPGTILFKWEVYSGLVGDINRIDPIHPEVVPPIPAVETHPNVAADDVTADICPTFIANEPYEKSAFKYPHINSRVTPFTLRTTTYPSYVNMSRAKPFVHSIKDGLKPSTDLTTPPTGWRGGDPREGAMEKITQLLNCASGSATSCSGTDSRGPYMESTENEDGSGAKFKFYPNIQKLNWLCPASPKDSANPTTIRESLKFHGSGPRNRWPHAEISGANLSAYPKLINWHNARVDTLVDQMDCEEYQKYAEGHPVVVVAPPTPSNSESHSFCATGAHMCWQTGMQKMLGAKLKEGGLSFIVPEKTTALVNGETKLEASLHFANFMANPIRSKVGSDFIGRNDGTSLSHCPRNMDVSVQLTNGDTIQVCDVQPMIGFIEKFARNSPTSSQLANNELIGFGNANLASGGAFQAQDDLSYQGLISISQANVRFEKKLANDPYEPSSGVSSTASSAPTTPAPSLSKNYQLFWPSWKASLEPSRVMSRALPPEIAPLLED
ncbi:MAG: hypothetical protein NT027_09660 [Proteobacteria bacterium]|nr:hypothetical protein [Pseudomonadota bacterium]